MTLGDVGRTLKRVLILAGPNGAGKTTFAREFLPDEARCPTFVNADLIAVGLSPFRPEAAAMRAGLSGVDASSSLCPTLHGADCARAFARHARHEPRAPCSWVS